MVEHDFYLNTYLGSVIPEKAFPGCIRRAEAHLERLEKLCRVDCPGEDSRAMALCAMAEEIFRYEKSRGISYSSVGNVTVRYDSREPLTRLLTRCAGVYLDIYRGVGA